MGFTRNAENAKELLHHTFRAACVPLRDVDVRQAIRRQTLSGVGGGGPRPARRLKSEPSSPYYLGMRQLCLN